MSQASSQDQLSLTEHSLASYLPAATAAALSKHLGLTTVGQALEYYPRKYLPRGQLTSFADLLPDQEVTILARVLNVQTRKLRSRRGSITDVTITDQLADTDPDQQLMAESVGSYAPLAGLWQDSSLLEQEPHTMTLSFFNAWTAARQIHPGDQVMFSGKVSSYRGQLTLTNPHYAVLAENRDRSLSAAELSQAQSQAAAPIPVYRATGRFPTDRIEAAIAELLQRLPLEDLPDPLPQTVRKKRKIPGLAWTYSAIHRPDTEESWRAAQYFLRYREAFILQSALAQISAARASQHALARPYRSQGLADQLLDRLPFELTQGQRRVSTQISADLAATSPMNRLLQGDVGSGKTVLALLAMLQVVDGGGQAALLAPTEVLAEQHYRSVCTALGDLLADQPGQKPADVAQADLGQQPQKVRVVLLKSLMPAADKRQVLLEIASQGAHIVIGTHALLSQSVRFAQLGLVVVDEQHRFGVEQRDALRGPQNSLVHRLVMTATPIPRTVAMTAFGDLDLSVLDQLPAGRQKIKSYVVPLAEHPSWEQRLWQRAREEIDAGHQVYVVVPKIGDDEEENCAGEQAEFFAAREVELVEEDSRVLHSVHGLTEQLKGRAELAGVRIASLHGRMESSQKSGVMNDFTAGSIDLLVCTTVIEVGVNVPNATLMIIMDADRFGISGLHQLRGRIGRGSLPGTCLLVTAQPAQGVSRQRLDAVAQTADGFELARIDLEQRREGDILGAAQSGKKSRLKLLRALADAPLIEKAREDARALFAEDSQLANYPELTQALAQDLDPDRQAFLGRG